MRGLWARERVDGGVWREGSLVHRIAQRLEDRLLRDCAGVVVLAAGAKEHLPPIDKPFAVVPTAVDLDRFRPGLPPPPGGEALAGREVFVVAGALGTWYLLEPMLDLLALALERSPDAHALILTEEDATAARAGLAERGAAPERVTVTGVPWRRVPNWFSLAACGILLIRSAPSKRASAPTKLGEFLASGVPVITTPRIGDSESLLAESRTGVIVRDTGRAGLAGALDELSALRAAGPDLAARCRRTAEERLSLEDAIDAWARIYGEIRERGR